MARGAHAAPRTPHASGKALRKALVRTGAFSAGVAATWMLVTTVSSQGYLDAFAAGTESSSSRAPADTALSELQVREVNALNRKYDCSTSGLAPGQMPARTVVRVGGEIRLASFDEGWAVHLGEVPGTLVSVCAR